jgi:hypothetical protein
MDLDEIGLIPLTIYACFVLQVNKYIKKLPLQLYYIGALPCRRAAKGTGSLLFRHNVCQFTAHHYFYINPKVSS